MVEQAVVVDTSAEVSMEKKRVPTADEMAERKKQMMASLSKFIG